MTSGYREAFPKLFRRTPEILGGHHDMGDHLALDWAGFEQVGLYADHATPVAIVSNPNVRAHVLERRNSGRKGIWNGDVLDQRRPVPQSHKVSQSGLPKWEAYQNKMALRYPYSGGLPSPFRVLAAQLILASVAIIVTGWGLAQLAVGVVP